MKVFFFAAVFIFFAFSVAAQQPKKGFTEANQASWIGPAANDLHSYGVFNFRKLFTLNSKPLCFVINISADNTYLLYINGNAICRGPQISDVSHWKYDEIDIAPYMQPGTNLVAVTVCHQGKYSAWAQLSLQTGLFIKAKNHHQSVVNTDTSWRVQQNLAYQPLPVFILAPNEEIIGEKYPWGWQKSNFNDTGWDKAIITAAAAGKGLVNDSLRKMSARNLPFPQETNQKFSKIRKITGAPFDDGFIKGKGELKIQPGAKVSILIDQGVLTTAFPEMTLSGGKGAKITITYAESFYNNSDKQKGNRNAIENKHIKGNKDIIMPDGGKNRIFKPLFYRTFRYVELLIENGPSTLCINNYHSNFTSYPFKKKASFKSDDSLTNKIWETGWRTAQLCAYQTFMDCPYYEQLQYIGDTRIQALISMYVSGDERLMKNAITQFSNSQRPEGITLSRYPANAQQIIPPFSLFWVSMVHDYWMLRKDDDFVKSLLPGIRNVLKWHKQFINDNNMLGKMPYWNFVDWPKEWPWKGDENISGIPDGALTGNSSILTLQYVAALENAAELFKACGDIDEAIEAVETAKQLKTATYKCCWDSQREMMADAPNKKEFSQHANVLAVLTNTIPFADVKPLLRRTVADTSIIQCTLYYRFYMNMAFKNSGLGDDYNSMLTPWKNMLKLGLTTFAERPEPTRSDCHGWSASPTYDLLATVCGIEPSLPGFKEVKISPHLGSLKWVAATMPDPNGLIKVKLRQQQANIQGKIELPPNLYGYLYLNNKKIRLHPGKQTF